MLYPPELRARNSMVAMGAVAMEERPVPDFNCRRAYESRDATPPDARGRRPTLCDASVVLDRFSRRTHPLIVASLHECVKIWTAI